MSSARSRRLLAATLVLAACGINKKDKSDDPWAASGSGSSSDDGSGSGSGSAHKKKHGGGLPSFDSPDAIQSALKNIVENLDKPGPYEPQDSSPGFDSSKPHWGVVHLSGAVTEQETYSWTGGRGTELRELIERLRELAKDPNLAGLVVRVEEMQISLPDAAELRDAIAEFEKTGKQISCHAEAVSNGTYLVMAACNKIGLSPLGEIVLSGPAAMPVHLKGLLDKAGVEADFLHVGAYKGAAEPLTRDAPSPEMLETLNAILDRRYQTTIDWVSASRGLAPDAVKAAIDTALFQAPEAVDAKLADSVETFEAFRDRVTAGQWTKIPLHPKDDPLTAMKKVGEFLGMIPPTRSTSPHVAVVYAVGDVVDGTGDGLIGAREHIASETLTAALHTLAEDPNVKSVVLRIDSGGGSALASELIWNAVHELKAKKPVIVSMSDVAASGGYYIASGATKIFALDDTLTGSIGVVGGRLALGPALAKLGVTAFPMGRGKRATMFASLGTWNADERAAIQKSMDETYALFVKRVSEGRGKTADQIQQIAQGRVWTGAKAKELGLVDAIGGLGAALAEARKDGNVPADEPLEIYPPRPTLRDVVVTISGVKMPLGLDASVAEIARTISPAAADVVEHALVQALSFQQQPIQTVTILPVVLQ
jgi:protease-4